MIRNIAYWLNVKFIHCMRAGHIVSVITGTCYYYYYYYYYYNNHHHHHLTFKADKDDFIITLASDIRTVYSTSNSGHNKPILLVRRSTWRCSQ